jgi:hypothetical protein
MYKLIPGFLLFALILTIGCQKDISQSTEEAVNSRTTSTGSSPRLSYGDSIFYLRYQPGNYIINPVSKPAGAGYFKAIPLGLQIDSVTGNINVSQSETGVRYKVFYFSMAGSKLDSTKIVISGIDYNDQIIEIAATPNSYDTAFPLYNAKRNPPLPCGDNDDDGDGDIDDDDNGCVFDETDLDDDGNDDIPGVIQDKLLVDIKKGTIDAEASFHAGVFGSSDPANGITRDFTFYYRLQDASNRALNRITVRLYHFKRKSDIPQWLIALLQERANTVTEVNSRTIISGGQITDPLTGRVSAFEIKPIRPPIIVIVSQ